MVPRGVAGAALALVLLAGCSNGGGPSSGLEDHLRAVAETHDAYYDDHGRYPNPEELAGEIDPGEIEEWNLVTYYGQGFGYCLEGDDADGTTWHFERDEGEPVEGECPRSGGPVMDR